LNKGEFLDGALEGVFRDADAGKVRLEGLRLNYAPEGDTSEGISRADLMRACVSGSDSLRNKIAMELVLREAEAGERHVIVDLKGVFVPLIDYIPSLRVYKVGSYAAINPFRPSGDGDEYAKIVSTAVQSIYGLSRDERIYLGRALQMAYRDRVTEPTMEDITDRLLQIQAEVQPKEGYKVECLRNVLWELEKGAMGRVLKVKERRVQAPAVFDLSPLRTFRERVLLATCIMMRAGEWAPTCVVVDPADWVLPHESAISVDLLRVVEDALEGFERAGIMVHLGVASPSLLSRGVAERMTSYLFCGPLWDRDLYTIDRTFALTREEAREIRHLGDDSALLCVSGRDTPVFVSPRFSQFRSVSEDEVVEHMRVLGEEPEGLWAKVQVKGARMLEKIFRDRAALVYAREMLRLVEGGKVPVEAVNQQKNVLLRAVVRGLKRYFMIVEYTDSIGAKWYRLTKAGERALAEMEGGEGGDVGNNENDGGKMEGDLK